MDAKLFAFQAPKEVRVTGLAAVKAGGPTLVFYHHSAFWLLGLEDARRRVRREESTLP